MSRVHVALAVPGDFIRPEIVTVIGRGAADIGQRIASAIKVFARQHGISPLAVDYTVHKG